MGRYKYLLKNIGLLTLSSLATKLLSFFLVPLYTNILTTEEYGIYDLFGTTIAVLIPILTLNIQDAIFRFCMDERYEKKAVISIGFRYFLCGIGIISLVLLVNNILNFSELIKLYGLYFWFMFLVQALSGIITCYIRGIGEIRELAISSVIFAFFVLTCNIIFLVAFNGGLVGYFLANIIGPLVQSIYLIIKFRIYRVVKFTNKYHEETKDMLAYSKPMIMNTIAWWVNNMSDKYVVIFFWGVAENGIYSVAAKIPSILNIFQSIFAQAWTLSAVKDFDTEDKSGFLSNTYKIYNCLMTIMCSGIILSDKILAKFLYAKDFYIAWKCVPWLTIAIVFGSMSGHIGGVFAAAKETKIFAKSTVVGAVANVILNIFLTPILGIIGAAIATMLCYFIIWVIRYLYLKRLVKIRINIYRDLLAYVILVLQSVVLLIVSNDSILYFLEGMLFLSLIVIFLNDISLLAKKGMHVIKRNV